jgi:ubiquinol-cytochrome c reductase cytochrome c1 subunit
MMTMVKSKIWLAAVALFVATPALSADHPLYKHPREAEFHQDGIFGTFDRGQLQRGFQVYKEVCAACHGLRLVAYRNLEDLGFSETEIKAIAKGYDVATIDDAGEPITRKGLPSDRFGSPYANPEAARAANGAVPPDLSLITKARHEGPAYLVSLLTGYTAPPKTYKDYVEVGFDADGKMVVDAKGKPAGASDKRIKETKKSLMDVPYVLPPNGHYNPYFPATSLAMPAPLSDGQVTYSDGTKASVDQMARDVATFLSWSAEPKLEARKKAGTGVLAFLALLIIFSFISYKRIWANVKK